MLAYYHSCTKSNQVEGEQKGEYNDRGVIALARALGKPATATATATETATARSSAPSSGGLSPLPPPRNKAKASRPGKRWRPAASGAAAAGEAGSNLALQTLMLGECFVGLTGLSAVAELCDCLTR